MLKLFRCLSVLLLLVLFSAGYAFAVHEGPGKVEARLVTEQYEDAGIASIWNSGDKFIVNIEPTDNYKIKTAQIFVGVDPLPTSKSGALLPGRYPYNWDYSSPADTHVLVLDLEGDLGFLWGEAYEALRIQNVSIFLTMDHFDNEGNYISGSSAWAYTGKGAETGDPGLYEDYEGLGTGWWFSYEMAHPSRGHFIDAPVAGLSFDTSTHWGKTDEAGGFDYFPGETVKLSIGDVQIGTTVADAKISPLDFYSLADTDDHRVVNMAMLLQSLDENSDPQDGIVITDGAVAAFEKAMADLGLTGINFENDQEVENIIVATIDTAAVQEPPVYLTRVGYEDAQGHLEETLNNVMFRKNISKTPDQASTKAKMATSTMWFPALPANSTDGTDVKTLEYYDETGALLYSTTEAHPIVVTYTDDDPITHAADVWAAVSMDDGETFKRMNLSRTGDLSSFTLANGQPYYGKCKKPVVQFRSNVIMVAWSSKYALGGKPRYAIDIEDDYTFDDTYAADDIWGVSGPQRSYDYTPDGFPEVGEVPHSALWIARGVICTQKELDAGIGSYIGDIVWYKPERLTSGRRDVNQIFLAGAAGTGFGVIWQEDPNGVRPGRAVGPGPGWGGATTSHKTDIWYSYLPWPNVTKLDANFVAGGDPEHDLDVVTRPKALIPWELPIRLSDNDVVNTNNILVETSTDGMPVLDTEGNYIPLPNADALAEAGDGTHRYATEIDGLISDWYSYVNYDGANVTVAVTEDGRLLDGDTGASRPNLFLQTYEIPKLTTTTDEDGVVSTVQVVDADGDPVYTKSAWAIITYEETKGAGAGPPDTDDPSSEFLPEEGKNIIYHSFDFKKPDLCSGGGIVNSPEFITSDDGTPVLDEAGHITPIYLVDENGGQILNEYSQTPQLAYQNARRGRFLPQGVGAIKLNTVADKTGEVGARIGLLMVYKEGPDGSGRPSDIMLRRWIVPDDVTTLVGTVDQPIPHNPYCFEDIDSDWVVDADSGQSYFATLPQNVSSVTPTEETPSLGDPNVEDPFGAIKVVKWTQTIDNLADPSFLNPYDDARAHRGAIRNNHVVLGFSYTPNWAAARNGNDKYDFYIRRSYDGGATWTTDPMGSGTTHCNTWTDPVTKEKSEECFTAGAGEFEVMRNLSQLPNANNSVIEPRIVAVPGTIKDPTTQEWTGIAEDKQNPDVYYVAYGTSTNPKKDPITGEQEEPVPEDLFWSVTTDFGESYLEEEWVVNPESDGILVGETVSGWDWMAKGDQEQGEVQLRMTPDGSKFYGSWLDEGDDGSDIVFRRIMSSFFTQNLSTTRK